MEDQEIVLRCRQGDAAAYELLVRKYQSSLVSLLGRMFGNRDDARDAAQEAFIQAYLKLASFDPQKSFKSWLFAIAMHRSIDLLRRRSSFRRFIAGLHPSAREAAAGPESDVEASPLCRHLLSRVSVRERAVLLLIVMEECSTGEIAAAMNCSETTVRVHLLNARRKLRGELDRLRVDVSGSRDPQEVP